MSIQRWQVCSTVEELPSIADPRPFVQDLAGGWAEWRRREQLQPGTPFLLSPNLEYDVSLNDFFRSVGMAASAITTQDGYARDLASFLTFLWNARERKSWRDATEADHLAYLFWRRRDPDGPRVSGATWNREVAAVNGFYRWALRHRHVQVNPIPQQSRRSVPADTVVEQRDWLDEQRPATYARDVARDRVQWLPPAQYRLWRDVGIRGYGADGLPRQRFRGRWAARNSTFCDLMVRTGLRVSEQAALTVFEMPSNSNIVGYERFWLPAPIAKGNSARWVYVPGAVIADLNTYIAVDRRAVIADAQSRGVYRRVRRPLVVEDRSRAVATSASGPVKVALLSGAERRRLLIEGVNGLEPASFWLGEHGEPLSVDAWKKMFADANDRCTAEGLGVRAHAHMLRHTFAVVTLEQLQRGHLSALAELTPDQRGHYSRVFGDPLDWVRRRLGHASVVTTQIYLHALAELEMTTRMALVPDGWDLPVVAADSADVDSAPM